MTAELHHMVTECNRLRALGVSFPVALGVAIDATERLHGRRYDWRASFAPTGRDVALLRVHCVGEIGDECC